MKKLSGSLEDYLESIYILKNENGEIRLTDVALDLKCSKPSVNKAVSQLKNEGYLTQEKYGQIKLTSLGEKTAKEIYFRHETLVNFLHNTLKVDHEIAKIDACKMEHVISPQTLTRLLEYMRKIENIEKRKIQNGS